MEEWADRTSTCLGCTPGSPSAPHTPCGGTGAMPGMPSRPRGAGHTSSGDFCSATSLLRVTEATIASKSSSGDRRLCCAATAAGDKMQVYCRGCCMAGAGGVRGCAWAHPRVLACQGCLVLFHSGQGLGRVDTILGRSVEVLGTRLLDGGLCG